MLDRTYHRQEHIAHTLRSWCTGEVGITAEFRCAVLSIMLRRVEETAELVSKLRRVNHKLEAFSYPVSHGLRAPLHHIADYAELLDETEGRHVSERR